MEIWKDIPLYGGRYQASKCGKIRSKNKYVKKYNYFAKKKIEVFVKGKILKGSTNPVSNGYCMVHLGVDGKRKAHQVGRLILMAFVGMPEKGEECCHNNGISYDNRLENLRWDTHENNNKDRVKHGTYVKGANHHYSVYPQEVRNACISGEITRKVAVLFGMRGTTYDKIIKEGIDLGKEE